MSTVPAERLATWTSRLLERWGYSAQDAAYIADTLVDANLRGVDSHGVIRLAAYHRRIEAGLVEPTAVPEVVSEGSVITVDGHRAAGQLIARAAADAVAEAAARLGSATVNARGSAHFGAAGYFARSLARRGFIAVVVSNSEPIVVPFGGRSPLLGTNPFAFAAPADPHPVSLDMATSTTAMGKVLVARGEGRAVPADWGVDAEGRPTTDPERISALLPFGGAKGYGIGFLVEVLAGVLGGAAVSHGIGNMYSEFSRPQDVGHWMLAIDVTRLMPLEVFTERIATLVRLAHATEPAPGFDGVLVPGEPEERIRAARLADGVPLGTAVSQELRQLGARFGEPFDGEVVA